MSKIPNIISDETGKRIASALENLPEPPEWMVQPVVEETTNEWLDNHPEATTTVQDGSIEEQKINAGFLPWIKNNYVTPEMFGAVGDGVHDDTEAIQECFSSNYDIIKIDKIYYIKQSIIVSDKKIIGNGKIIFEASKTLKCGIKIINCKINNISFESKNLYTSVWLENGDNKLYSNVFIWSVNSEFKKCEFKCLEDVRDDESVSTETLKIIGCIFTDCSEGVVATNCNNILIKDCMFKCLDYAGTLAHCIYISGGCNNTLIDSCIVSGSKMYPIQTYNSKSEIENPKDVTIQNCTIIGVSGAIATNADKTNILNCNVECNETFLFCDGDVEVISSNISCKYVLFNTKNVCVKYIGNIINCNNFASSVKPICYISNNNIYNKIGNQGSFLYAGAIEISLTFNTDNFLGFDSSSALFVGENGQVRIIGCYIQEDNLVIWRKQSPFNVHMINNVLEGKALLPSSEVVTNVNNVKIPT